MLDKGSTALATTNPKTASDLVNDLAKLGYDVTGMTEAEVVEFAETLELDAATALDGIDLKPTTIKVNKDLAKFVDPSNTIFDSITGIVVLTQKARAYWPKGTSGRPTCRSFDCTVGHYKTNPEDEDEVEKARTCATCPNSQWGSAVNDRGEAGKGQACKETRRVFLARGHGPVPAMISLPPTSITVWDEFMSARSNQDILPLQMAVRMSLENTKGTGFSYAKLRLENGERTSPRDIVRYGAMKRKMMALASRLDMEREDAGDAGSDPATTSFGGSVDVDNALADD